jgi:hypothetical protein
MTTDITKSEDISTKEEQQYDHEQQRKYAQEEQQRMRKRYTDSIRRLLITTLVQLDNLDKSYKPREDGFTTDQPYDDMPPEWQQLHLVQYERDHVEKIMKEENKLLMKLLYQYDLLKVQKEGLEHSVTRNIHLVHNSDE